MARLSRLDLSGIPQHVVQRGNNRLPCFLDDEDRQRYLQLLLQAALATQCQLHAYIGEALPQSTIDEVRLYLQQQRTLGRDTFRAMVEAKTQYFAGIRPAHRPCKLPADTEK